VSAAQVQGADVQAVCEIAGRSVPFPLPDVAGALWKAAMEERATAFESNRHALVEDEIERDNRITPRDDLYISREMLRALYNQHHPQCPSYQIGVKLAGHNGKFMHPGVTVTLPTLLSVVVANGGVVCFTLVCFTLVCFTLSFTHAHYSCSCRMSHALNVLPCASSYASVHSSSWKR
jgi:hypothetical protein